MSKLDQSASLRKGSGPAPHVALVSVQLMFGSWPIVGKLALKSVSPNTLVSFRVVGAALAFLGLQKLNRRSLRIARKDWPLLLICSLLGVAINQALFVNGLKHTTAINATLLSTTIPVSTLLIGVILGRTRGSLRLAGGIFLAAAGVILLVDPTRATLSDATLLGDILVAVNSLC